MSKNLLLNESIEKISKTLIKAERASIPEAKRIKKPIASHETKVDESKTIADTTCIRTPICGVLVSFPFAPYPSQLQMMSKIITALERKSHDLKSLNALIESPTGTGKSLALLCSILAWKEFDRKRFIENHIQKKMVELTENNSKKTIAEEDDDLLDFQPISLPNFKQKNQPKPVAKGKDVEEEFKEEAEILYQNPIVYFASRTHKQLAQLIKELRQTPYRPSMSVLGSRNQYCIHKDVMQSFDRNSACMELISGNGNVDEKAPKTVQNSEGCKFYNRSNRLTSYFDAGKIWDIEDIIKAGKRKKACPYFASREISKNSEIVFVPYNYIIDPMIRKSMNIRLENSIVVIDEAHNLEDTCRESGSIEIRLAKLEDIKGEILGLLKDQKKRNQSSNGNGNTFDEYKESLSLLSNFVTLLINFINSVKTFNSPSFEKNSNVWNSEEMKSLLTNDLSITQLLIDQLDQAMDSIKEKSAKENENMAAARKDDHFLSNAAQSELERLIFVLKLIISFNKQNSYCLVVSRINNAHTASINNNRHAEEYILSFWLLNPQVVFERIATESKSVILTSGTLSPLDSFASELGTEFPLSITTSHVIKKSQIWVGVITTGKYAPLLGNYNSSESFVYQDSIGLAIADCCEEIPGGILVFFPSYGMLDKMLSRWQSTGILSDRIKKAKNVFIEPKSAALAVFEKEMNGYMAGIQKTSEMGSIFFCVFRGKVSEGIDFKDDAARAVISVGIPFANLKDLQILKKKQYNDSRNGPGLTGNQWYTTQAFRALNQALGRCIRHINDWGAVIILEERLGHQANKVMLPKWIQHNYQVFETIEKALPSLKSFVAENSKAVRTGLFPGSQPVSFERRHLEVDLMQKDYLVCEKSDGNRYLLFIAIFHGKPKGFLIDRNMNLKELSYFFLPSRNNPSIAHHGTLLDGELLVESGNTIKYKIFDGLALNGRNVMNSDLLERLKRVQNDLMAPLRSSKAHEKLTFKLELKQMHKCYDMANIFSNVIPRLKHGNDGLIFTPVDDPYVSGTCQAMLKWKSAKLNTVDFKLMKKGQQQQNNEAQFELWIYTGGNTNSHRYWCDAKDFFPSDSNVISDDETVDGRIAECFIQEERNQEQESFDVAQEGNDLYKYKCFKRNWKFLRFRNDKVNANHIKVMYKIFDSIIDGVTEAELIDSCTKIQTEWKKREQLKRKRKDATSE